MSSKEDILKKYRANVREKFDMPDLSDIKAITYADPLVQFIAMSESVGGHVIEVKGDRTVDSIIQEIYPDAKEIASNLPEVTQMWELFVVCLGWLRTDVSGFLSR